MLIIVASLACAMIFVAAPAKNIVKFPRRNERMCTSCTCLCHKPCEHDAECLKMPRNKGWLEKLDAWFASQNIHRISSLVAKANVVISTQPRDDAMQLNRTNTDAVNASDAPSNDPQLTTNSGCPPAMNLPDPLLVGEETAQQQEPKRNIVIENVTVRVEGAEHVIQDVPKTHAVVSRGYLRMLKKKAAQIDALQQSMRRKKHTGSPLSKRLLASALASVPGFSLAGAELAIPLVVAAFLADPNLIDDKIDLPLFSQSFASAHNLRDMLISSAVDSLIEIGNQIHLADNVFVSCDKGNKKGLSHFVKILSCWDKVEKEVQTFVLDVDASEGTSEGCAEAIEHSMKKLNHTAIALLILTGQTTDSGGGGVSESLMSELNKRNLCTPTHLVASCTLHAIQIALANPVKKTLGEGKLGGRTMMQMLHSACEVKLAMQEAALWVQQKRNGNLPNDPRTDLLTNSWDRVNEFALPHQDIAELPEKVQKTPQPVLTRWWCVDVATAFLKQNYRIILRAT
jgi:hypothetical protein